MASAATAASDAAIRAAAEALQNADALLICTGAGMGVDSGLGTFRGKNAGVWPPLKAMQMDFSEMSQPSWFTTDPRLAWAFWHFRHQAYTKGAPHAGYELLKKWGQKMQHGFFSVTSNIDGHWERTIGETLIFECHGAVTYTQFLDGGEEPPWRTVDAQIEALDIPEWNLAPGEGVEVQTSGSEAWVPATVAPEGDVISEAGVRLKATAVRKPNGEDLCRVRASCPLPSEDGRALRPNVLMFGDWSVDTTRINGQERRFDAWFDALPKECKLVVIEIGAGTAVSTIRRIGEGSARRMINSTFIRINLEDSTIRGKGISIGGMGALAALTQLDTLVSPSASAA